MQLLNRNPSKRLGSGPRDAEEIKEHEFFAGIDWDNIAAKQGEVLKPKIRPIQHNIRTIKSFQEEEKESEIRFADFMRVAIEKN